MAYTNVTPVANKQDVKRYTAAVNAVTASTPIGIITSSTSNLGAATSETITVTLSDVATTQGAVDVLQYSTTGLAVVNAWVVNAGTGGNVVVTSSVVTAANTFTINVRNVNASSAMTSTYQVAFQIVCFG